VDEPFSIVFLIPGINPGVIQIKLLRSFAPTFSRVIFLKLAPAFRLVIYFLKKFQALAVNSFLSAFQFAAHAAIALYWAGVDEPCFYHYSDPRDKSRGY